MTITSTALCSHKKIRPKAEKDTVIRELSQVDHRNPDKAQQRNEGEQKLVAQQNFDGISIGIPLDMQAVSHADEDDQRYRPDDAACADARDRDRVHCPERIKRDGERQAHVHANDAA